MHGYSPNIWQRFRTPLRAGALSGAEVHIGEARTPASKAVLRLYLRISGRTAGEHIQTARFQALGCPSTIAAADWICEWLEGRALVEGQALKPELIAAALALPAERRHCALLAEDALRAALGNRV